jgi:hypothetical protein
MEWCCYGAEMALQTHNKQLLKLKVPVVTLTRSMHYDFHFHSKSKSFLFHAYMRDSLCSMMLSKYVIRMYFRNFLSIRSTAFVINVILASRTYTLNSYLRLIRILKENSL